MLKKLDLAIWSRKIFMNFYSPNNDLFQRFFSPLFELYPISEKQYQCTEISDIDYMKLVVLRCISKCKTGHEFLQLHGDQGCKTPTTDHFFKALKSKRRLTNLTSVNQLMKPLMKDLRPDPLQGHFALEGWTIKATDGHHQQAAMFDPKKTSATTGKKTKIATGHFFS